MRAKNQFERQIHKQKYLKITYVHENRGTAENK